MTKKFLHVGCGSNTKINTTPYFNTDEWEEVRLDMDPDAKPDIVLSMLELHKLPLRTYDAIYCAHALEHVYCHEVMLVLAQFNRLLKHTGHVVIAVPDLQTVCQYVVDNRLSDTMYNSPSGPITPLDTIYGLRSSIRQGHYGMAHRSGFTARTLGIDVHSAAFQKVTVHRDLDVFEIRVVATLNEVPEEELQELTKKHFPRFVMEEGYTVEELQLPK